MLVQAASTGLSDSGPACFVRRHDAEDREERTKTVDVTRVSCCLTGFSTKCTKEMDLFPVSGVLRVLGS